MEDNLLQINFKVLLRVLRKEIWSIFGAIAISGILGWFLINLLEDEFISQGKILPEAQGKGTSLGQLSGFAALAGVDLASAGSSGIDAIRPDLYPDLISSTPFLLDLFNTKVRNKVNKELTFEEFYHSSIEKSEEFTASAIRKFPIKEDGIIVMSRLNEERLADLRARVTASIDKKTGMITISSKMPDPVVAAGVTKYAMDYLMDYIKNYRTEKLQKDLDYLANQVASSRGKYYSTQQKKVSYSDQFQIGTIHQQSSDIQRERIESEYRLSSTFYNELLKKYEEAKFKLHQETPVFKVLEPPVVPTKKSEPKRLVLLSIVLFVGGVIGVLFALLRGRNYRKILNSQ